MVATNRLYKMLSLLFLMAVSPAMAEDAPESLHFTGRYDFIWSGVALANVELGIEESRERYSLRLAIVSAGIVNLFTHHRSETTVSGRREDEQYYPEVYESYYWTKNKPRHIKITYDHEGAIKSELVEPPENRAERPEVEHALKDGTLDPLTLVRVVPWGVETPHVFDAKHLYEGKAVKGEQVGIRVYNGTRPSVPYTLTRKPLAGMTQKEMRDYAKGEPSLQFYFSADIRHIPLYASMPLYLGMLRGTLAQECRTWDECKVN